MSSLPSGQFLLEQSRLGEAAEMAERAAELDRSEFDVVFSAAHMLRFVQSVSGFSSALFLSKCLLKYELRESFRTVSVLSMERPP